MNNSLRDEAEALERDLAKDPRFWSGELFEIAKRVRAILFRHPPADGVSVPRDLFEAMRDDQIRYLGAKVMRGLTDGNDELQTRIEQADAILSEGKA